MPKKEPKVAATEPEAISPLAQAVIDFQSLVCPPYHGEETHPDPRRLIVPIGVIYRDPNNARLHPDRNLNQIRASLRRKDRGQQSAVNIDRWGKILKGNGTHESAELEGWKYIWITVSNLDGPEALAYENADNASGLSSGWNFQQLAEDLRVLKEFDGTEMEFSDDDLAFADHEMSPLLAADWSPGTFTGEGNEDDAGGANAEGTDPHSKLDAGDRADNCPAIAVTPNMREASIDLAIERVRLLSGDMSISEGMCVQLICADYLSGVVTREDALQVYEREAGLRAAPSEEIE
jgi:hypothetical protein